MRGDHVVSADGRAHPRRFAYGVPTEAVHWVTAAGIRPGVDSVTLGDSDAMARAVLDLPAAGDRPAEPGPAEITLVVSDGVVRVGQRVALDVIATE